MKHILFLLTIGILIFSSCKTDEVGELDLKITATYDNEPLVNLSQVYTYPDGTPIKIHLFNYYLSDISLIKEGASSEDAYLLSEVEFIEYADFYTTELAQEGIQLDFKGIPDGIYSGLRMGIGLAPDLNGTQPGDYTADHALANNYWSWANGYVFSKFEATADVDGDSSFSQGLTYHIGQDDLYKVIDFTTPIRIENGKSTTVLVNMEVLDILKSTTGDYLDITQAENTQDHTNNDAIFRFLWTNLTTAIEVTE